MRVAVGDRIGLRDRLVRDILAGLIGPALFIAPLLGILIWLALARGLAPLKAVTDEIAQRDGEDMRPLSEISIHRQRSSRSPPRSTTSFSRSKRPGATSGRLQLLRPTSCVHHWRDSKPKHR